MSKLNELIKRGEGESLDFKHNITDSFKIAISLASFANHVGGILLVGVDDKGKIVGINEAEEEYMLQLAANQYCKPPIELEYKKHFTSNGKVVLECQIPEGNEKPYLSKDKEGKWTAFIRNEDQCRKLSTVRYLMFDKLSAVDDNIKFSEHERLVIELLKSSEEGMTKNAIIKKLGFAYKEGISVLANLLKLSVLKEIYYLNKWVYQLK